MKCPECKKGEMLMFITSSWGNFLLMTGIKTYYECSSLDCGFQIEGHD